MFSPGPIDVVIATVLSLRRFGFARTAVGGFVLTIAIQPLLPAVPCSCFRPTLRRCSPNRMYEAAVKSDLKNLASQEEIYFSDTGTFTTDWKEMGFVNSNGVRVTIFSSASGWSAWATHAALGEDRACGIVVGDSPVRGHLGVEPSVAGEVVCR